MQLRRRSPRCDHHEVLTILLRIGAIGVVLDADERYTKAVFDYTLPDNLNYRPDDSFCVHPIFVEEYRVVDPRKNGALPRSTPRAARSTSRSAF